VSSFVSMVTSYRISGNMSGTDKDGTEIDSLLLVSLCYTNSVLLDLFLADSGNLWQKVSPFG
jgi:hypothetical protein